MFCCPEDGRATLDWHVPSPVLGEQHLVWYRFLKGLNEFLVECLGRKRDVHVCMHAAPHCISFYINLARAGLNIEE